MSKSWIIRWFGAILLLVGGFYFLSPTLIELVPFLQPLNPQLRLNATSIVASVILTFALIVVYREIAEIQRKQTQLTEAQYMPMLNVGDFSIEDPSPERIEELGESVEQWEGLEMLNVTLLNTGDGMANNIKFHTSIGFLNEENEVMDNLEINQPLPRTEHYTSGSLSTMGGSLEPSGKGIDFRTPIHLSESGFGEMSGSIAFIAQVLDKFLSQFNEEVTLRIQFSFTFSDVVNNQYKLESNPIEVELEEGKKLQDILRESHRFDEERMLFWEQSKVQPSTDM